MMPEAMTPFARDILATLDRVGPTGPERLDRILITRWDPDTVSNGLVPTLRVLTGAGLVDDARGFSLTEAGRRALDFAAASAATSPAIESATA